MSTELAFSPTSIQKRTNTDVQASIVDAFETVLPLTQQNEHDNINKQNR